MYCWAFSQFDTCGSRRDRHLAAGQIRQRPRSGIIARFAQELEAKTLTDWMAIATNLVPKVLERNAPDPGELRPSAEEVDLAPPPLATNA